MASFFQQMNTSRLGRLHAAQAIFAGVILLATPFALSAQKAKLPRPRVLERGAEFERDPATGELQPRSSAAAEPPGAAHVIRARVGLVEVGCTVTASDGVRVSGLARDDFRLLEDGVEQKISSFDAAQTPASILLVLDASPSIYREFGEMREAAQSLSRSLQPDDEVSVVAFADQTEQLLPFSRDRDLLAAALDSPELARVADSSQSLIYQALYLSARELFAGRSGRKAIVLVTDGQDSGLGLTWNPASMQPGTEAGSPLAFEDVAREIAAEGIELDVISTESRPHAMTDAWLAGHQHDSLVTPAARSLGIPQYTLYLAELVRQVGGALYFLREIGGLAEVYHRIALKLGAEYTLGYYPAAGIARPGWRALDVELRLGAADVPSGAQVIHRAAYYVPASSSLEGP
jgi:VWFA-related protein